MAQTKITVDYITALTSSAAELNYVDITTLGTAQASKVLTADANIDVGAGLRNLTGTGFLQGNTLRTTVLEYTDGDDAITIVDGGGITVAQNAIFTGTVRTPSVLFKGTSNSVTIDADNPAAYTVVLPNAAPTGGGKVLQTASGQATVLEWGTPAGGGPSIVGTTSGNQIMTANSDTVLNGEANLTFDGQNLSFSNPVTSSSSTNLMVYSSYGSSTSTPARLILRVASGNDGDAFISFHDQGGAEWAFGLDNSDSGKIKLGYGGTVDSNTRLTIQTDGLVGIGTSAPEVKFHVQKGDSSLAPASGTVAMFESSDAECYIQLNGASDATGGFRFGQSGGSATDMAIYMHPDQLDFRFDSQGSHPANLIYRFGASGAVTLYSIPSGSHNDVQMNSSKQLIQNVSSRRYKKDERDFSLDSKLLQQLVIKDFTWKEDTGTPNKADFGVIAEDTYDICPELVSMIEIDGEMVPDSVPARPLLMMAVAEIQRLHTEIELLKS